MNNQKLSFIGLALLIMLLQACTSSEKNAENKTQIVAVGTTGMIADALKNIAGEKALITSLMGPGVDPHLYKVTQGDLKKLQEADIIFYNGLHLEGKMSEVLEKLSSKKKVVAFSDGIDDTKLRVLDTKNKIYDPHLWFDVSLWKKAVYQASVELCNVDTINKKYYEENTLRFTNQLDSLHIWVASEIATIPKEQRMLVTAHDAFGYFGDAYDIEVKGLQGISTVADYGLNDVNELVNSIVSRRIKSIFIETSVSDKSIKAVVEGCKARGHNVNIGGALYSDALGAPDSKAGSYVGMVKENVRTIVNALK